MALLKNILAAARPLADEQPAEPLIRPHHLACNESCTITMEAASCHPVRTAQPLHWGDAAQVVDNLLITRHVVRAYGKAAYNCTRMNLVSSIEPGVMAKTGMETAEIIGGVVKETEPDVLIAVDALAARSIKRLNRTIQITNTGIQPGSGVGNHRNALTKETLGVPVIAIGIPTVVDAATIVGDALEKLMNGEKEFDAVKYMGQHRMAFAELNNMYMTGKDIDSVIKRVSYTVSEGINIAMEKNWV